MGGVEKEHAKFPVHASGGAENGREKRNVLIVRVLLPIAIDLALRSNMQRRVDVLRECPILQGVAATPITVMGNAEVENRAASLVPEVIADLHRAVGPRWP